MKRFWSNLLLSSGSGVLMSLAAAPLNGWWLAWIALMPFWSVISSQAKSNQKQAIVCAFGWGASYHGLTLFWILGLHPLTWMGIPWLASIAIALFCWIFITLWGTATNIAWAWLMQYPKTIAGRVLVGTAAWCGFEFLLNLTPLSWTSLSFTQSPGNLVILHLGRLSGPLIVTAAIVAVNGLLAEAWMQARRSQRLRQVGSLVTIAGLITITAHSIGAYFYSQPLADVAEQALTIGVIQGNIPTREKLSASGIRRAIQGYVGGYETLAAQGVNAVLMPEGAMPFLWDQSRNPLRAAVVTQGVPAWLGIFVGDDDGNITQSLLALDGSGNVVGRYNKIKLVPLGEYIPFQDTIGQLIGRLSPIRYSMVPGTMEQRFDTPFGRAIASICYESVFPELFRQQAQAGQFILTASNLDPYGEVLMAQHQAHDLMRAIETDRWAARATNTGYSGFIDPHGRILARSQPYTYQLLTSTIYRRQTQTPYVRWGDWFTPMLLGIAAIYLIRCQIENLHP